MELINQPIIMANSFFGKGAKSFYESPLAEEIVVSFEENFLMSDPNPTSSSLWNPYSGGSGSAGGPENPNDFRGGSYDLD